MNRHKFFPNNPSHAMSRGIDSASLSFFWFLGPGGTPVQEASLKGRPSTPLGHPPPITNDPPPMRLWLRACNGSASRNACMREPSSEEECICYDPVHSKNVNVLCLPVGYSIG